MTDTAAFPPPPPPRPPRRLLRPSSRQGGRQWLGVARCLSDYLGVPVGALRLAFLVGATLGGFGLIVYVVAALLIPTAELVDPLGDRIADGRPERLLAVIVGAGLVLYLLFNNHPFDTLAVLALVAGGAYLWSSSTPSHPLRRWWHSVTRGDRQRPWPQPRPDTMSAPTDAGWVHVPPQPAWRGGQSAEPLPDWAQRSDSGTTRGWQAHNSAWNARSPLPDRPRRPSATWATLAAAIGVLVISAPFVGAVDRWVASGLMVLVVGLVVGLIARRRVGGLIAPALLLAMLLIPATFFARGGVPLTAGVGEVTLDSRDFGTDSNLADRDLTAGHLTIDLRNIATSGPLRFRLGTGQIDILVPANVQLDLRGHVGAGEIDIISQNDHRGARLTGGTSVDVVRTIGTSTNGRVIEVEARVGMGAITVRQTEPEGVASTGASTTIDVAVTAPLAPASAPTTVAVPEVLK